MPKENKKIQEKFSRVIANSMKWLDSYTDQHMNDFNYIPESIQPYINNFVREGRKTFDWLSNNLELVDKSSDEYIAMQKEMENTARSFINARGQVDKYKEGVQNFKSALGEMNEGTQDANYFLNSAVFGNQWDDMNIDKDGNFQFQVKSGEGNGEENIFKLNDIADVANGGNPIITEPYGSKKFVWDLANRVKKSKDSGIAFDKEWVEKMTSNNLHEFGPNNIIGMAHTDMSGDGRSKSFADMYEEGLNDKDFYIHPLTGENLPEEANWMKDKNNTEVTAMLLTKYISNVMSDIYHGSDQSNPVHGLEQEMRGILKKLHNSEQSPEIHKIEQEISGSLDRMHNLAKGGQSKELTAKELIEKYR